MIDFLNEAGEVVLRFTVYGCWPTEYVALSTLDANGEGEVLIESLTLEHEGWERDTTVQESTELG